MYIITASAHPRVSVAGRPPADARDLPAGIRTIVYPWLIWLSWELEERWRVLHAAWRRGGDREAGVLLQREIAALAGWDRFLEVTNKQHLVTAHLAASLALALADARDWSPELLQQARAAADALIERDVWPWLGQQWKGDDYSPARMHNVPVITLARTAQLARVIGSPRAEALDEKMRDVLRVWCRLRTGSERHAEGTAYDGYLFDSITEWLSAHPVPPA